MRLKSYFAHSVEDAIQKAKGELGGEAMLVDTKLLTAQPGNRARVEVIFATPAQSPAPPPIVRTADGPSGDALTRFRGGLTCLLDALSDSPGNGRLAAAGVAPSAIEQLHARMIAAEVARPLIQKLTAEFSDSGQEIPAPGTDSAALLAAKIPRRETGFSHPCRIALLGPTGSGKTTMAAKLAYKLGLERGIAPLVLSLDNVKIGAADQLSRLCRLLGVAFQPLENFAELQSILEENERRRLILIDSPGLHEGDPYLASDLAECLTGSHLIQRHLVLPASARTSTMERWFTLSAPLAVDHLLFTRLDETGVFGPMWSLAVSRQLPLSWISRGPGIPDDIEPADVTRICSDIVGCSTPPPHPRANAARAGHSPS